METGLIGRPTFGGLATGLDTTALLNGLLAAERLPLDRIEARRAEIDTQRGLMRDLNTKLLALREAAQELDNRSFSGDFGAVAEEFLQYSASSSNDDVVTVTAGSGAAPGAIEVRVDQLARASRRFSNVFTESSAETALGSGQSMTISIDNGDPSAVPPVDATLITIQASPSGTLSLADIRDQINTSAENGGTVRADILRISDDALQLVITSTQTGLENQLTITGDLGLEVEADEDKPLDAKLSVFGQTISRSSNVIDDVLTGITLRLQNVAELINSDDPPGPLYENNRIETVTVDVDVEEVAKSLETFTKAYNDVMSFIERQSSYDEATNARAPLAGDFTLRRVQGELRDLVSQGYAFQTNPSNPFASGQSGGSISGIGIELESGGTLKVNREILEEALTLDALSVREFLSGRERSEPSPDDPSNFYDQGFASQIARTLESVVRSGDGALAERDKAFADRLSSFDDSIERFEERLGKKEESLILRFSALERIVAGLQSQSGFLTSLTA